MIVVGTVWERWRKPLFILYTRRFNECGPIQTGNLKGSLTDKKPFIMIRNLPSCLESSLKWKFSANIFGVLINETMEYEMEKKIVLQSLERFLKSFIKRSCLRKIKRKIEEKLVYQLQVCYCIVGLLQINSNYKSTCHLRKYKHSG